VESTEHRGPEEQLEHDTEELEERIRHVGEGIEESRSELKPRQEAADDPHVRDWGDVDQSGDEDQPEDEDEEDGGDPAAFDDPENLEDEEDA